MSDPNFYIESPRLYLSYFQPALDAHCDFLVELYNSPEFIRDATGGKGTSVKDREAARTRLQTFVAHHERNGYGIFLVSRKPPAEEEPAASPADASAGFQEKLARAKLVGTVSLLRVNSPTAYKLPDLGFAMLPEEMRKGYAKEASQTLLEWAKRERGVDVAFGFTDPTNAGANGLFKSLGFEYRGIHKLVEFGGDEAAVWISQGGEKDLSVYGL